MRNSIITTVIIFILGANGVLAAEVHWVSAISGNWSDGGNWIGGLAPAVGDDVLIDAAGTYTVTLDMDIELASLTVGALSGEQTLALSSRTLSISGVCSVNTGGLVSLSQSTLNGGGSFVVDGTLTLDSGNTIDLPLVCNGVLNVHHQGNQINGSYSTSASSLMDLRITQNANPQITFANGFTNLGAIELGQNIAYGRATRLNVTTGELVNAASGTILCSGTNGSRTIAAPLNNQGLLTVSYPATLSHATETIASTGSIVVDELLTLTVTGDFNYSGGTIDGPGVVHFSSANATINTGAMPAIELQFTNSSLAGPGAINSAYALTFFNNNVVAASLHNSGTINVHHQGNHINGSFSTTASSLLDLRITQNANPQITFANGFTNLGAIELGQNIAYGRATSLNVTTGELVNAASGTILCSGTNGSRTIAAPLNNQGLLTVSYPTTVSHGVETITNTGSMVVDESKTLTVTGDFYYSGGTIDGPGVVHFSSANATINTGAMPAIELQFTNSSLAGPGTINSAHALTFFNNNVVAASLHNSGTINVHNQGNQINGSFSTTVSSLLDLRITQNANPQITFANGFTNLGAIELGQNIAYGRATSLNVTTGELVNAASGTILCTGTVGSRTIAAPLNNQGLMTVSYPTILSHTTGTISNTGSMVIDESKTLTVTGDFNYSGGTIDGPGVVHFSSADVSINTGFMPAAELQFTNSSLAGSGTISSAYALTFFNNNVVAANLHNSGTINVHHQGNQINGSFSTTASSLLDLRITQNANPQITFANGFTNLGAIELGQDIAYGRATSLNVTTGELVNAASGTILCTGTNGSRTIAAPLNNQGLLTVSYPTTLSHATETMTSTGSCVVDESKTLTVTGDFNYSGGTINGPGVVHFSSSNVSINTGAVPEAELQFTNSTLGSSLPLDNAGTLTFFNNNTVDAGIMNAGTINVHNQNNNFNGQLATTETSLLNLEITQNANPQMTIASGFINYGTIEMDQAIAYGRTTVLAITTGTLVIAPGGVLRTGGSAGTRGIFADFENQGSVVMAYPLSINGTSAFNAPGGIFEGTGSLSLVGTPFVNGGDLSPGVNPTAGQLNVFNDFVQEEQGVTTVQIGGLAAGTEHDKMTVANTATLDGTLNIELTGGFIPAYGDSFIIVDHGSRMGEFSALSGVDIGGGLLFNIAYRPDYVVLAAGDFLPPATRVVTASAEVHGSISPEGQVYVPDHGNVTFTINPQLGYDVGDVLVDNVSVGPAAQYHFGDVTSDHTIAAYFTPVDFTYEEISIGSDTDMNGVDYLDHDNGVIVGDGGEIHITGDGGLTWWQAQHGVVADLQDVRIIGDLIFVVGAQGTVCISYDGGLTWVLSPTGVTTGLNAIEMVHSGYGYTVGDNGTILCWDGQNGWIPQTVPGLPANSHLMDITIVDGIVYVVGSNGLIIRRDGPDADWVIMWSGQSFDFHAVSFHGGSSGYAVGTGGNVWYTNDWGITWTHVDVGVTADLHDCFNFSGDNIQIVGDGKFIRSTNGGLNWHEVEFPNGGGFRSLTIADCRGVVTGLLGRTYEYETNGCVEDPGHIQGHVRLDGVGQEDVTLLLKDVDGTIIDNELTNSAGFYEFRDLEPQFYLVEVVLPSGQSAVVATRQILVRAGSAAIIDFEVLATSSAASDLLPRQVAFMAFPNPFNPMTTIHFETPHESVVVLEIYDSAGRRVNRLINGQVFNAGRHTMTWQGEDGQGRRLASGVYHYRIQVGQEQRVGKMTLLK